MMATALRVMIRLAVPAATALQDMAGGDGRSVVGSRDEGAPEGNGRVFKVKYSYSVQQAYWKYLY